MKYKILWFIKRRWDDIYYSVRNGIPSLVKWFPVIWMDRQWDFYFIYRILLKKLVMTEKHIRKYSHHLYRERDADQIRLCILLLKRLLKDDYHENVFMYHDKKWGQPNIKWIEDKNLAQLSITRENVKTEKEKKQEMKEFRRLSEKVQKQRKQDVDFLFNYVKKHIEGWWD